MPENDDYDGIIEREVQEFIHRSDTISALIDQKGQHAANRDGALDGSELTVKLCRDAAPIRFVQNSSYVSRSFKGVDEVEID